MPLIGYVDIAYESTASDNYINLVMVIGISLCCALKAKVNQDVTRNTQLSHTIHNLQ